MNLKTIKNNSQNSIVINKSKFYNFAIKISNVDDVNLIINDFKTKHPNATHICYAYVIGESSQIQKQNDDGEPKGTAGLPILNIIKHYHLSNVIVLVVRYFGGIKLGSGGLIRGYSRCAKEVLDLCEFELMTKFYYYKIIYHLSNTKIFDNLLYNLNIDSKNNLLNINYMDDGNVEVLIKSIDKINIKEIDTKISVTLIKHDF